MTPADEKTHAKVTAVLSAIMQFATTHAWVVRKGIFAP
jgi:alpha-D-ribose 1-methylphosphonate 5-triphosphate synthase subunit PhnG